MAALKASDLGIYILESNSAANDDWITDHSGDPGEADMTKYTEGLEMIHIQDVTGFNEKGSARYESETTFKGWQIIGIGSGKHDFFTYGDIKDVIIVDGELDLTHLNYWRRAWKEFNISRAVGANYIARYLVWQYDTDTFFPFYDEDGDSKNYCPVVWLDFEGAWANLTNVASSVFPIRALFGVVWT